MSKKRGLSGHEKVEQDRAKRAKDRKSFPDKGINVSRAQRGADFYKKIKAAQKHMAGRTEAVETAFAVKAPSATPEQDGQRLAVQDALLHRSGEVKVFTITTKPVTLPEGRVSLRMELTSHQLKMLRGKAPAP